MKILLEMTAEPFLTVILGGGVNAPPFLNIAPPVIEFWPHDIIPFQNSYQVMIKEA